MINEKFFYCAFSGENFDPSPLLPLLKSNKLIQVDNYHLRGDIREIRGNIPKTGPKQYGYGYIDIAYKSDNLDEYLDYLMSPKILSILEKADDKVICITFEYEGQCNLEFTLSENKKINDMGLILTITCYEK